MINLGRYNDRNVVEVCNADLRVLSCVINDLQRPFVVALLFGSTPFEGIPVAEITELLLKGGCAYIVSQSHYRGKEIGVTIDCVRDRCRGNEGLVMTAEEDDVQSAVTFAVWMAVPDGGKAETVMSVLIANWSGKGINPAWISTL